MASVNQRAILNDIHDLNLDPTSPHSVNWKTGRLKDELVETKDEHVLEAIQETSVVEEKLQPVEQVVPEQPSAEPLAEEPKEEQQVETQDAKEVELIEKEGEKPVEENHDNVALETQETAKQETEEVKEKVETETTEVVSQTNQEEQTS